MIHNKLHYNSVSLDGLDKDYGPHFICPECDTHFKDDRKAMLTPVNTTGKYNQRVDHKCPKCGAVIRIYVAATKMDKGEEGLQISVNPIDSDWLEKDIDSRLDVR